ncbi:MAG: energy-coupling factor transporter transmembrane protein EcfT [Candidatus Bathyarchaeota archaeon]|nr:MAG: energy-coupling factor transporter transmembrane protein EcfT [Candidatus Bathyarchaeota archaeon]
MRAFEGLRFRKVSSPIHRLDPRAKFIGSFIVFSVAVLFTELMPLIALFLLQVPIILAAKVVKQWLESLRGALFLSGMIFVMNLFVGYALLYSAAMSFRFLTLVASFSWFFLTTSPDDLGLALERSRVPYELCFAFTTAVRFVPVLADEAQTIIDAQRSRGLELDRGDILKRIRNYIPILIPLIVNAIRRSLELAEAMESRAFGSEAERTSLHVLEMRTFDYVFIILAVVLLFVALYVRFFIPFQWII